MRTGTRMSVDEAGLRLKPEAPWACEPLPASGGAAAHGFWLVSTRRGSPVTVSAVPTKADSAARPGTGPLEPTATCSAADKASPAATRSMAHSPADHGSGASGCAATRRRAWTIPATPPMAIAVAAKAVISGGSERPIQVAGRPAVSQRHPLAQGGELGRAEPVHLLKLPDRGEPAVLRTPVQDALGHRGTDAGKLFELVRRGGVEMDRPGQRYLAAAAGPRGRPGSDGTCVEPAGRADQYLFSVVENARLVEWDQIGSR